MSKAVIMDTSAADTDKVVVLSEDTSAAGKKGKVVDKRAGAEGLPARAIKNADGTITLPLRQAVSVPTIDLNGKEGSETYDKFTFHNMKGKDIRAVQAAAKGMENIVAFSRATGINQAVMDAIFDEMSVADINDGAAIMSFFTAGGR